MENSCYRPQASILVSISYLLYLDSISDYVQRYAYLYPIHTDIDIEPFQTEVFALGIKAITLFMYSLRMFVSVNRDKALI